MTLVHVLLDQASADDVMTRNPKIKFVGSAIADLFDFDVRLGVEWSAMADPTNRR
jgi:hypothetical protein